MRQVILNPAGLDDSEARRADEAREKIETLVEIYVRHFEGDPCPLDTFMATIARILESRWGRALWPWDRARIHLRAFEAVKRGCRRKRRSGRWSHPPEILDLLVNRLAPEAREDGAQYSDGAMYGSAFEVASDRLFKDFGVRVSAAAIRKRHQELKRGIKTAR